LVDGHGGVLRKGHELARSTAVGNPQADGLRRWTLPPRIRRHGGAMSLTLVRTSAANVEGVDGSLVDVEVSRGEAKSGPGRTSIVGLPGAAVREAIDRTTPALMHSGLSVRGHDRLVVNLAAADRRKAGTAFDPAIALGLAATLEENRL